MLETLGMNAAGAAVDNTIGLIAGGVQANRQMRNQRKLMAEQLGIDKLKMEELLAVQEEYPSIFKIENPIRPKNAQATSPRKQKRISVWQILLLVTLFWLAIEELDMTDDSNFFPVVFILTLWGILQKRRILPNKAKTFIDSWWHPCAVRLRAFHINLLS